MTDSFNTRSTLEVGGAEYEIFRLDRLPNRFDTSRLPFSLKILLENLLRHEDGTNVTASEIEALAGWDAGAVPSTEIAFTPSRVLLQDFTGVPAVVDLAAMRDAMRALGGDPAKINPLSPVELVIDHSVQVDRFGSHDALARNTEIEFERNRERYAFLRWGQKAFRDFKVVPPGTGIVHQINLEYLARVVFAREQAGVTHAYPDTVVGTDSHTTMVNGLGVLGWGVGGIEAEAAMLGQPISMLIPQVVGFELTGKLPEGATATDLVLTVVEMLRARGVVGKFVEFFGEGLDHLPLADRTTIANMAPEYGATCGIFPIDAESIGYLRLTGRPESQIALVEAYARAQGLFREPGGRAAEYSDTLVLDMSTVEPCISGPKRPQDRINAAGGQERGRRPSRDDAGRTRHRCGVRHGGERRRELRATRRRGRDRRDHLVHQHVEPGGAGRSRTARAQRPRARPRGQALGEDELRPRLHGGEGLPREGGTARRSGRSRLPHRRVRVHHLHRQLRPSARGGQRRNPRRRPHRQRRPVRQPELRRAGPRRGEDELPRLTSARGRLRPCGPQRRRLPRRAARRGCGRRSRVPARHLAVEPRNPGDDRVLDFLGDVPRELRRRVRRRRAVAGHESSGRESIRVGRHVHLRSESAPTSTTCR